MQPYRSRKFCILLYPEDNTHIEALEFIKNHYDYAYILHDKDWDKNGEIKKEHYHIVINCPNAIWNTALSVKLGIEINYIQNCRNYDLALNYLIHMNDDTKHQYDIEEVKGTLVEKIKKALNNDDVAEDEKVMIMINYLESTQDLSFKSFVIYACNNGYYDVFRRSATIFIKLLDEQRAIIYNRNQRKGQ